MSRKKHSAACNAPFGTDVQPTCDMKIIGGRAVEIPMESPAVSAKKSGRDLPPVHNSPKESPRIPSQFNYQTFNDLSQNKQSKEQQERLRAIASRTSPPDKSNSHIHGIRSRSGSLPGAHRILPPIPKSDRPTYPSSENTPCSTEVISPNEIQDKSKISMTVQLQGMLKEFDPNCFKDMYKSLAEFDHRLTGYVNQAQLNMIALRHGLPIPTTMLRLLFSSFAKGSNPDMVNYEKLLQYLARAQLGSAKAETMLHESINRFVSEVKTLDGPDEQVSLDEKMAKFEAILIRNKQMSHEEIALTEKSLSRQQEDYQQIEQRESRRSYEKSEIQSPIIYKKPVKVFSERDDAMLLMLIEQQIIQGKEDSIDLAEISDTMSSYDKYNDGTITQKQFQEVCLKHRLPFQGSVLEKMLMRCDTGDSKLSWIAFIDFLSKVQSIKTSQEQMNGSSRPGTWPSLGIRKTYEQDEHNQPLAQSFRKAQEQVDAPWQKKKPLGPVRKSSVEEYVTRDDTPSPAIESSSDGAEDVYQRKQLTYLAKKHQALRDQSQEMMDAVVDNEVEPWFSRFMHLAQGLYNSDSTNTGYLPKEEMLRLVNNYNLIYNLKIPAERIYKVINSCVGVRGQIMIEPVLESLRLSIY
ncbi:uncharacterized protein C1orf87-like [Antedon mediterranea]|uniref:uncharacterized protein C1orf87-like n=1 Tax=Antedon mediterranea TaxID=105859 RepID=UPI003AF651E9